MCYVIEVSNTGKFGIDPIQSKDTASIADTKTNTNIKKKSLLMNNTMIWLQLVTTDMTRAETINCINHD